MAPSTTTIYTVPRIPVRPVGVARTTAQPTTSAVAPDTTTASTTTEETTTTEEATTTETVESGLNPNVAIPAGIAAAQSPTTTTAPSMHVPLRQFDWRGPFLRSAGLQGRSRFGPEQTLLRNILMAQTTPGPAIQTTAEPALTTTKVPKEAIKKRIFEEPKEPFLSPEMREMLESLYRNGQPLTPMARQLLGIDSPEAERFMSPEMRAMLEAINRNGQPLSPIARQMLGLDPLEPVLPDAVPERKAQPKSAPVRDPFLSPDTRAMLEEMVRNGAKLPDSIIEALGIEEPVIPTVVPDMRPGLRAFNQRPQPEVPRVDFNPQRGIPPRMPGWRPPAKPSSFVKGNTVAKAASLGADLLRFLK